MFAIDLCVHCTRKRQKETQNKCIEEGKNTFKKERFCENKHLTSILTRMAASFNSHPAECMPIFFSLSLFTMSVFVHSILSDNFFINVVSVNWIETLTMKNLLSKIRWMKLLFTWYKWFLFVSFEHNSIALGEFLWWYLPVILSNKGALSL